MLLNLQRFLILAALLAIAVISGQYAFGQVNVVRPVAIINAQPVASTVTSTPVHIMYLNTFGIQFTWTGTPTCTLSVLVSNQTVPGSNPPAPVAGSFTALTLSGITNPAGSAGSFWLDLAYVQAEWMEAAYTSCSGSGTLNAFYSAKGV